MSHLIKTLTLGSTLLLVSIMSSSCANKATSDADNPFPDESRYLYRKMPDAPLIMADSTVALSQLWQDKPLIFTMVFSRCAGVCYPFISSLQEALPKVGGLGTDYRIAVVSFDPEDNTETMQGMAHLLDLADHPDWLFGITARESIDSLTQSIGYWTRWDSTRKQYDHPAVLVGILKGGLIARFLVNATVSPPRLHEIVRELRGEFISAYPKPNPNVIFSCFQYDPSEGFTLSWGFFLLLLPAVVTIGGTGWIFWSSRHRRV